MIKYKVEEGRGIGRFKTFSRRTLKPWLKKKWKKKCLKRLCNNAALLKEWNPPFLLNCCLMSSDVSWHIRDKLWPMPKHGSMSTEPEGSLGRTAQDGHLASHTAPELCPPFLFLVWSTFALSNVKERVKKNHAFRTTHFDWMCPSAKKRVNYVRSCHRYWNQFYVFSFCPLRNAARNAAASAGGRECCCSRRSAVRLCSMLQKLPRAV